MSEETITETRRKRRRRKKKKIFKKGFNYEYLNKLCLIFITEKYFCSPKQRGNIRKARTNSYRFQYSEERARRVRVNKRKRNEEIK